MAMEAEELEIPGFLENSSEDEIHEKMLANLPDDIDKAEGGFPWDFTRPTAIELSELKEYVLVEVIKSLFPATCEESYLLDMHGTTRGLSRRESVSATGIVRVTAAAGTIIPLGYTFSTEANEEGNTVDFVSTEEITVDGYGNADVPVEASEGGASGNVGANTIVLQSGDESGLILEEITSVTNPEAMKGGLDEEDDDSFRERLVEYDQRQDSSFIGNPADYKRWAMSVAGVGAVTVIPAQDDSGTVTLVITGQDGYPANETICKAVEDYIMSPDSLEDRLAPIGATVVVTAPDTLGIAVTATLYLSGISLEEANRQFTEKMDAYLLESIDDKVIRLSRIGNILGNIEGIYDYTGLTVTTETRAVPGNIELEDSQVPILGSVSFTEG